MGLFRHAAWVAATLALAIPASAQETPKTGGTLTVRMNADIRATDGINRDANTDTVMHAIYETLVGYRADVTVGIGMIKARYAAEIALSEIDAPHRLRLAGSGLSSMGAAKGSGLVSLAPQEGGTLLRYDYEAEVSGKVAAVGGRMLEGAAKIVLKQLFEQLGRQAGGPGAGAASRPWWRRLLQRVGGAK